MPAAASHELAAISGAGIDLALSLNCGQVFHWQPRLCGWAGCIDHTPVYVEQRQNQLRFAGADARTLNTYLALDHDMSRIAKTFPKDEPLRAALRETRGMRILRQPKWECLATFILSAQKQVGHIRQLTLRLRETFGEEKEIPGARLFTFPGPQKIAAAGELPLRQLGLGWRAKYLAKTAQRIAEAPDLLNEAAKLPDDEARELLCTLPGVGEKIADCVLLFAYERLAAFPVDVWIQRVLDEHYRPHIERLPRKELRRFLRSRFGPCAGYAQQMLFHAARSRGTGQGS